MLEPESKPRAAAPSGICEPPVRPKPQAPDHELIRRIGEGAYGEVWLAKSAVGTYRAVKVVYRDSFKDERPYEREFHGIQKFEPISRTNDGFVDILQIGRNDTTGCFYYVMELADDVNVAADVRRLTSKSEIKNPKSEIDQSLLTSAATIEKYSPKTLRSEIQRCGRLPFEECLQFALSLNLALGQLHRHGLIHRDIKPSNIIFIGGIPKLADIGLVAELEAARSFVGTEGFIPPEGPNSAQADIYSLGKVLYEMSMGKDRTEFPEPFTALGQATGSQELEELNAVILRACAPNPRDRYQSAEDMHVDLALLHSGKSVKSKRMLERRLTFARKAGAVVGLVAVVAVAAYLYQQFQTREARRLAKQEALQRTRAEAALLTLKLERARELITGKDVAPALTQFAHLLRQHPTNRFIAEQIIAILYQRNFALPLARLSHSNLTHAEFSADGAWILTESKDSTTQMWDARTGKPAFAPVRHGANTVWTEFTPDGERIATAAGREVRISSARTGRMESSIVEDADIERMAISPDGTQLLIVSGKEAWCREMLTGKRIIGPLVHEGKIDHAAFNVAGNRILTSSKADSTARVWHAQTGALLGRPVEHRPSRFFSIHPKLSSDGLRLITVLSPNLSRGNVKSGMSLEERTSVCLWSVETGEVLSDRIDDQSSIRFMEFSRDGTRLLIGTQNGHANIYDGLTGRRLAGPLEHEGAISAGCFSQDGRKVATGSGNAIVRVWDAVTSDRLFEPFYQGNELSSYHAIRTLTFSPDGERMLLRAAGAVCLWDLRQGSSQSAVLPHDEAVTYAQFSPDGNRLVTALDEQLSSSISGRLSEGKAAWVWEAHTGRRLAGPLFHQRGVTTAAFSPTGGLLATGSRDGTVRLWNPETGTARGGPLVHGQPVGSLNFSRNGDWLWTGSWQHSAWLWNAESGVLAKKLLHGETGDVEWSHWPNRTDDLSPDEQWIATCSGISSPDASPTASAVQVWNSQTGEPRYPRIVVGNVVRAVRFSPDGEQILATVQPEGAIIWSARTGERLIGPLQHEYGQVHSAAFSPDGTMIVTAGLDRAACVWDSRSGRLLGRPLKHRGEVAHAEFSPDNRRLVTAGWTDQAAFLWDVKTGLLLGEPLRHDDWVTYATFSPDGHWVVTTSCDRTARIWVVPMAATPSPEWLAELAEAVAGQQLDAQNRARPVPLDRLLEHREHWTANTQTDDFARTARWLFGDRSTRAHSPGLTLNPVPQPVTGTKESLRNPESIGVRGKN